MLQLLKRILKIIQKKPLGERLRKSTKKGGDYMTELEWAKENHIRNLQNLTNGKSAFENYKDFDDLVVSKLSENRFLKSNLVLVSV